MRGRQRIQIFVAKILYHSHTHLLTADIFLHERCPERIENVAEDIGECNKRRSNADTVRSPFAGWLYDIGRSESFKDHPRHLTRIQIVVRRKRHPTRHPDPRLLQYLTRAGFIERNRGWKGPRARIGHTGALEYPLDRTVFADTSVECIQDDIDL